MATSTIEKDGRVRIPRQVLNTLGVDVGDQLMFEVNEAGQVVVTGVPTDLRGLRGSVRRRNTNVTISGMQLAIRPPKSLHKRQDEGEGT